MANQPKLKKYMQRYGFGDGDVIDDVRTKYNYDGRLLHLYANGNDHLVHKWHHYLPLYERYFGQFQNKPVRFLEIGVFRGGSLDLWRRYFGDDALIYGIDIDPDCAKFDGHSGQVRIGSQDDPKFLKSVVEEMTGVDVVLDDGSHHMNHIRASLATLFPMLSSGGVYMVEDLHTAYFAEYGGGLDHPNNFFNDLRPLADSLHRDFHESDHAPTFASEVSGFHVHNSMVVLEKDPIHRPVHSKVKPNR